MKKLKVSFDFDNTLSRKAVQEYAKELLSRGIEVWIVTSRMGFGKEPEPNWNNDLFETAKRVGINRDRIFFTCMADKSEFLNQKDFIFHLDDDKIELSLIKSDSKVLGIYSYDPDWKQQCEIAINNFKVN